MSTQHFDFQFNLLNKISGPANAAASSLQQLNNIMVQMNQMNVNMNSGVKANSSGLESWVTQLNSAIGVLGTIKSAVLGVTGAVAGMTSGFVNAVLDAAKFHAQTRSTLDTLFRNEPGRGRREFAAGMRLGAVLPGTREDAIRERTALASRGFRGQGELDRAFALQQDIMALSVGGSSSSEAVTKLLGDVKQRGHLKGEEVNQLAHLSSATGPVDVLAEIGRARGMQGTPEQIASRIQDMASHRQISGTETIAAMERAVVGTTGLGLGGFAHKQGTGLVGQLSNLEETPRAALLEFFNRQEDTMSSGGMSVFGNFLQKTNDFFRVGTPTGERFMRMLDQLINGVFGALFGNDPTVILTQILGVFEQLTPALIWVVGLFPKLVGGVAEGLPFFSSLLGFISKIWPLFQLFGSVIVFVESVWMTLFRAFVSFIQYVTSNPIFEKLFGKFIDAIPHVTGAVNRVTDAMQGTFRSDMEIHSPSRVMQRMGHQVTEGLALGVENSGHLVENASSSLSGMLSAGRNVSEFTTPGMSGAGSGAQVSITNNFVIPEGVSNAQEIADAVRPMVESSIAEMFERMALSAGVG